jgi:hypothetical protein
MRTRTIATLLVDRSGGGGGGGGLVWFEPIECSGGLPVSQSSDENDSLVQLIPIATQSIDQFGVIQITRSTMPNPRSLFASCLQTLNDVSQLIDLLCYCRSEL